MAFSPRLQARSRDDGGILMDWLVKLVLVLGLCGLAAYDAISITSTKAAVADEASYAASEAATSWQESKDVQRAYEVALAAAAEKNPKDRVSPKEFRIEPDGTVYLTVRRTAKTVVVHRIDRIAAWAKVGQEGSGRPGM